VLAVLKREIAGQSKRERRTKWSGKFEESENGRGVSEIRIRRCWLEKCSKIWVRRYYHRQRDKH